MTKTSKKGTPTFADLFRGPWSTAEAAQVGDVEATIIRNWVARSSESIEPSKRILQGRTYFWTRDAEPEREEQLRKAAIEFRATLERAGEDPGWITAKVAKLMREPGEVATVELVEAYALAELTRIGLAPGGARKMKIGKAEIVEELTRNLFERVYGKPPRLPGLLIAEAQAGDEPPDVLYVELDALADHLADDKNPAATRIVIDPAKLFRRLVARVEKVKAERQAGQEPKP